MSYRPDLHAPEALGAGEYDDAHAHTESTGYHVLKTWPELFGAIVDGWKTFEWRKADRNFEEGDHVLLREWDPATEKYTGRELGAEVGFVLRAPAFGVPDGYVAFSLIDVDEVGPLTPFGRAAVRAGDTKGGQGG